MTLAEAFEAFRPRLELAESYQRVVEARHSAVRSYLEGNLPGARTQLIGSLQRKTRINPPKGLEGFDIDILVELGSFIRWLSPAEGGISCAAALEAGERALASNLIYRSKGIEEDRPAIIVPYTDGSYVEIVPAYRDRFPDHQPTGRAYLVPRTSRWVLADYDFDAAAISEANKNIGGRLIPCIKMLRAWRRNLAPALRTYHLEVLALSIIPEVLKYFQTNNLDVSWPKLLASFFTVGKEVIKQPAKIPGSLSEPADYYLTAAERNRLAELMKVCGEAAAASLQMNDTPAIERWRKILGDPFPAA